MSNTKNTTASRKNRREKGCRAVLWGSKPHSNGEDFSRSAVERVERMNARVNTTGGRISLMIIGIIISEISSGLKV